MINVKTLNGNYTITESLFNMIKENNPSLLLEDNSYIISMLNKSGFDINQIKNKNERDSFLNKVIDNIPSKSSQKEIRNYFDDIVSQINEKGDVNSLDFDKKNNSNEKSDNKEKEAIQDDLFNDKNENAIKVNKELNGIPEIFYDKDGNRYQKNNQGEYVDKNGNVIDDDTVKAKYDPDTTDSHTMKFDDKKELFLNQLRSNGEKDKDEIFQMFTRLDDIGDEFKKWAESEEGKKDIGTAIRIHNNSNEYINPNDKALFKNDYKNKNQDIADIRTIKDFLSSPNLIEEIKVLESQSFKVIKRVKTLVHEYLGIWGDVQYPKFFNPENIVNTNWKPISTQKELNVNNDVPNISNKTFKTIYKNNPKNESKNVFSNEILNEIDKPTFSNTKLAFGGFKIIPYVYNNNEEDLGKALKLYISSMKSANNSLVYDMIKLYIKNREYFNSNSDNVNNEIDKSLTTKEISKNITYDKNDYELLEKFVIGFLNNVTYKMEINNNTNFQRIIDVIRYDPTLNDIVDVSNINAIKQFNTRENNLVFLSKVNKMPVTILTCIPLFAQGQEILKNLKPIWGSLKQLKG